MERKNVERRSSWRNCGRDIDEASCEIPNSIQISHETLEPIDVEVPFLPKDYIGAVNDNYAKLLLKYPWILSKSIQDNYREVLSLFDSEKVPKAFIDRAIKSWPHILGCSSRKLKLTVDQFGEIGVQHKKLGQVIAKSPQLLLQK